MRIDEEVSEMLAPSQRIHPKADSSDSANEKRDRVKWLEEQYRRHGGDKPKSLWTPFDYHLQKHQFEKRGIAYAIGPCIVGKATSAPLRPTLPPEDLEAAQKYTEAVLSWAGEKPDNYELKFLGEGWDGSVFWLSDKKKVLKITLDPEDAKASAILKRKPDRDLYKIYKVGRILDGYAIIAEKLSPLASSEHRTWDRVYNELKGMHLHPSGAQGPMNEKWLEKVKDEALSEKWNFPAINEKLTQIEEWVDLFTDRGILLQDFHAGNIMARGRTEIVSDMGRSKIVGGPSIPEIQV